MVIGPLLGSPFRGLRRLCTSSFRMTSLVGPISPPDHTHLRKMSQGYIHTDMHAHAPEQVSELENVLTSPAPTRSPGKFPGGPKSSASMVIILPCCAWARSSDVKSLWCSWDVKLTGCNASIQGCYDGPFWSARLWLLSFPEVYNA